MTFRMKRIIAIFITALLLISLVACGENGDTSSVPQASYPSRTSAFYANVNPNSFWFTMNFTNNGSEYAFTQATNGKTVTTIENHSDNSRDKYEIYDKNCIHKLYLASSRYDTVIGKAGQGFLFEGYNPSMFANPSTSSVKNFDGVSYHCESFVTSSTNSASAGINNYYFEGDRLKVIEIIEGGKAVMIMRITDYSNTIPSDIYLSVPADFKATNLEFETDVSFEDMSFWELD